MIRKISTSEAVPGMTAATDVYSKNNQLIINKDTKLTDRVITRLKFYSINEFEILIPDSTTSKTTKHDHMPDNSPTYSERVRSSSEFKAFNQAFATSVKKFKNNLNNILTANSEIDVNALLEEADTVIEQSRNGLHIFDMLHNMRQYDDLTYVHSLNVSLICSAFGKWLKFSDEEIHTLTLAGLLHDIGKLTLPQEIITKPGKLTDSEYATVKTHALKGYYILKNKNIDEHVKNVALMHHEKNDGSGYPRQLVGSEIDEYAKIVAIADIYDAMTSARVYRGPLCPFEVIEIFETEGYEKYDAKYLLPFLECIVLTYLNNRVKLNTGEEGEIVMLNKIKPSRPMIKTDSGFINLLNTPGVYIESLL